VDIKVVAKTPNSEQLQHLHQAQLARIVGRIVEVIAGYKEKKFHPRKDPRRPT
jgi:hypothetical protein